MSPQSYCDIAHSALHTLDCAHIVFSPHPSPHYFPKAPCGPTCTRAVFTLKPQLPLAWLKNVSAAPFICPQCVEDCVRADYDIFLARSGPGNFSSKETKVRLWTYAGMMDMVRDGGRECQGTSGVFATHDKGVDRAMVLQSVQMPEAAGAWSMRETGQVRSGDAGQAEIDAMESNQLTLFSEQFGHQATRQHGGVDELAEILQDAKVGLGNDDVCMDELLTGVEGLTT